MGPRLLGVVWGSGPPFCHEPALKTTLLLLALLLALPSPAVARHKRRGASRPPRAAPTVALVTSTSGLPSGPGARARQGDYRLDNGLITAVIDAPGGRGQGSALSGGNLIDLAPAGGQDELWQVFLYLGDTYPRQAVYEKAEPRSSRGEARLRVRGHDSQDPRIAIETEYILAERVRYLRVVTTVRNGSDRALEKFGLGDVIQWGQAKPFLPGHAAGFRGNTKELPWAAGVGRSTSYLYGAPGGTLRGLNGSSWSDVTIRREDIPAGRTARIERIIAVGARPDVASALVAAAPEVGPPPDRTGRVNGLVIEPASGKPVRSRVLVLQDGQPVNLAECTDGGRFTLDLPPGTYELRIDDPRRRGLAPVELVVPENVSARAVTLAAGSTGRLDVVMRSQDKPSAGKLTLEALGDTPALDLGPVYSGEGARNVAVTADGKLNLAVAPGRYRATCSRGIEFDIDSHDVTIPEGGTAHVDCELRRAVETPGRISLDLHQHAAPSSDSAVPLQTRVIADLAEGVEGFAGTDHNVITSYRDTIARLGVGSRIAAITSEEVTVEGLGHFNAYPLQAHPGEDRAGAAPFTSVTAADVFRALRAMAPAEKVIQLNHPRTRSSGYFSSLGFDPRKPGYPEGWADDFDAIEILNGKHLKQVDDVMEDWFELLRRGKKVTAVGNSDTHAVWGSEAGYPRNLVAVPDDDPARVTDADVVRAIKVRRDVIVTNGPLLTVNVGNTGPGGEVPAAELRAGKASLRIRVEAAPWVDVTTVQIYVSGRQAGAPIAVPTGTQPLRLETTRELAVRPGDFIVVVARGKRSLAPVVPGDDDREVTPFALANPIWIR